MADTGLPLAQIIGKCDEFFNSGDLSAAGEHLRYWRQEAHRRGDWRSELSLLSELMGHYRMMNDPERGRQAVADGFSLMLAHGETGSAAAGTVYINGATALQSFGDNQEAMNAYRRAWDCYRKNLPDNDRRFAGLFNNMASSCIAAGDFSEAENLYLMALDILQKCGDKMDTAVTFVNLAQLYCHLESEDLTGEMLHCAMLCFDDPSAVRDGYYAHTCLKCVPAFRELGWTEAAEDLTGRVEEIYERH
ncbi:MAG: tetratricopeptide repeat protein [Lentisphaeria bacterium]|nr:tetratricopeptide repeat protein [Lentisphaeria bacterium]